MKIDWIVKKRKGSSEVLKKEIKLKLMKIIMIEEIDLGMENEEKKVEREMMNVWKKDKRKWKDESERKEEDKRSEKI